MQLENIVPEYNSCNAFVRKVFMERIKIAVSYLKRTGVKNVLDAGCGNGIFAQSLKKTGDFQVVGVDINEGVEELNKKYSSIEFMKADILKLPGSFNERFDAVVCLDVLEHLEDIRGAVSSVKKTLKKGGYLVSSGPTESFWYKLGRFFIKITITQKEGPGAGRHFYRVNEIEEVIKGQFKLIEEKNVCFLFIPLFKVSLYKVV